MSLRSAETSQSCHLPWVLGTLRPSRFGNLWICGFHRSPSVLEGSRGDEAMWVSLAQDNAEGWWQDWDQVLEFQNFSRTVAAGDEALQPHSTWL